MERHVKVLLREEAGFTAAFEWVTKKKGKIETVVGYLMGKFRTEPPVGYNSRRIRSGDRLMITDPNTKVTRTFEIVNAILFKEI